MKPSIASTANSAEHQGKSNSFGEVEFGEPNADKSPFRTLIYMRMSETRIASTHALIGKHLPSLFSMTTQPH
jgi:hypothetical protein